MTIIPSLDSLVVSLDGNPITLLSLWQQYAIVKLNLITLNNITVRAGIYNDCYYWLHVIRLHQNKWPQASICLAQYYHSMTNRRNPFIPTE